VKGEKNPKQILERYQKGEIDRVSAIRTYISLIESSSGIDLRSKCIEYLGKIKPLEKHTFKKIESFLLSDISPMVRSAALKVVIQNNIENGLESLKWMIYNDYSSLFQYISIICLQFLV